MAGRERRSTVKKVTVSLVTVAALAVPVAWMSTAAAQTDPDANGDVHSNCHTGSKGRGAGGEDRPKEQGHGEAGCTSAPGTPGAPGAPGGPGAPTVAGASASRPSAPSAVAASAAAAVPVGAAPRFTG
jgi:hypothetical protein